MTTLSQQNALFRALPLALLVLLPACEDKQDTTVSPQESAAESPAAQPVQEKKLANLDDVEEYLEQQLQILREKDDLKSVVGAFHVQDALRGIRRFKEVGCTELPGTDISPTEQFGVLTNIYQGTIPYSERLLECTRILVQENVCFPNARPSKETMTPLAAAADAGYLPIVQYLTELGVDINNGGSSASDDEAEHSAASPLSEACRAGHTAVALYLMEHGAATTGKAAESLLHDACHGGSAELAEKMIHLGFDLNSARGSELYRQTPLSEACQNGHTAIIKLLVDAGAAPNGMGENKTPIFFACEEGNTEAVRYLLANGAKSSVCEPIAIVKAAYKGDTELVRLLVDAGWDVNARGNTEETPLMVAIAYGYTEMAELLEKAGAKPAPRYLLKSNMVPFLCQQFDFAPRLNDPTHTDGATPTFEGVAELLQRGWLTLNKSEATQLLLSTAQSGDARFVALLKEHGAEPDALDEENGTPMCRAVAAENEAFAEALIQADADVRKADSRGYTPLHYASCNYNTKLISLLLRNGAIVNVAAADGATPLALALRQGDEKSAALLLESGADIRLKEDAEEGTILHYWAMGCLGGTKNLLPRLLQRGADINATDKEGRTALQALCRQDNPCAEPVALLLQAGADPNAHAQGTRSALHEAVARGQDALVKQLLEYPCKLDEKDEDGLTPLHSAVENRDLFMVKLLTEHGANPMIKDMSCVTPVERAAETDNYDITEMLAAHTEKQGGAEAEEALSAAVQVAVKKRNIGSFIALSKHTKNLPETVFREEVRLMGVTQACMRGNTAMAAAALEQNCNVNGLADFAAPIESAVMSGNTELVQLLIEYGADLNSNNSILNSTPLSLAILCGNEEIFRLLLQKGAAPTIQAAVAALEQAPQNKNWPELLAEAGCDLSAPIPSDTASSYKGETLLCIAARTGNASAIRFLQQKGAGIDERRKDGKTPLMIAAEAGQSEIVRLLLDLGADPRIEAAGFLAEDLARLRGYKEIAELLRDAR